MLSDQVSLQSHLRIIEYAKCATIAFSVTANRAIIYGVMVAGLQFHHAGRTMIELLCLLERAIAIKLLFP
ncbi:MAG: hypothetical protein V7K26_14430 [Nostoc sp.]|uniref:hypothetical protein n=1 Tax=Nostoc sp. TaxID=1180 RepID=UPI002FEEA029